MIVRKTNLAMSILKQVKILPGRVFRKCLTAKKDLHFCGPVW